MTKCRGLEAEKDSNTHNRAEYFKWPPLAHGEAVVGRPLKIYSSKSTITPIKMTRNLLK